MDVVKHNIDIEGNTWLPNINNNYCPGDIGFDHISLKLTDPNLLR